MADYELFLPHSKIEQIPEFDVSIRKADLRRNKIKKMALGYSKSLASLDLSDNQIEFMENVEKLPSLTYLDLSYNLISEIKLPKIGLIELYLICNDIEEICSLDLPCLKKLDIAVNKIQKIENLEKCKALLELYLGSNLISHVPDLKFLENLRVLDLQNNRLEVVDCKLLPRSLNTLLLGENKNLRGILNIEALDNLTQLGIEKTKIRPNSVRGTFKVWYN